MVIHHRWVTLIIASALTTTACGGSDDARSDAVTTPPAADSPAPTTDPATTATTVIDPTTSERPVTHTATTEPPVAAQPEPVPGACPFMTTPELIDLAGVPVDLVPFAVILPGDSFDDDFGSGDEVLVMPPDSAHCSWSDDASGLEEGDWYALLVGVSGRENLAALDVDADEPFGDFGDMSPFAVELPGTTGQAFWTDRGSFRSGAAFDGDRFVFVQVIAPEGSRFDGPAVMAAVLTRL